MKMMEQYMITLSPLKEPEGLRLIHNEANRLGLSLFKKEKDSELLSLYKTTGGTPLAIKWAMGQTKQKGQSLKTVLKALQDASSSVFDNIFANSWLLLTPDSRKLLTIMPFFATSASKDSLEAVSDLHGLSFDNAISQLVEMSLLDALYDDRLTQQRYGIHPLTRTFVGEKIKSKTEFNAQRNLVDFYLRFAEQYGVQWGVGGGTTYTAAFNKKYSDPSHDERIAYLEAEIPNILDVIKRCWEHQLLKEGLEIFLYICDILIIYNYWSDVLDFSEKAIVQAKEIGDEVLAARLRISPIARIYRYQGLDNLAKKQVEQAELEFKHSKERKDIDIANVNYYLGCIAQAQGETEIAQKHLERALVIMKELGEERHSCFMMAHLAEVAVQKRELIVAHSILESALIFARQHNDNEVLSYLLRVFSRVVNGQNDPKAAKEFLREAILLTNIGRDKALMQLELAQIQAVTGEKPDKTELLNAQAVFKKLDMESKFQEVQVLLVECNYSG
jgi:tetratricopeptide (TPR) repeat protein